jgi:phage regulator Rha-like protein
MENLAKITNKEEFISSRQIAEATEKRHDHVLRDIQILIEKKAIDLIINQDPNLGFDIQNEPICFESSYQAGTGKSYPEYLLNEYATNVLAASYDPVIARKLLKLVKELKKAVAKIIDSPEAIMAKALLLAKDTMDRQQEQLVLVNEQLKLQSSKVDYYDKVMDSGKLTATNVIAFDLGISAQSLNKSLKKRGIIYRVNGTYVLSQKYRGKELAQTKTFPLTDKYGKQFTAEHLYWTEKGREFIFDLFNKKSA